MTRCPFCHIIRIAFSANVAPSCTALLRRISTLYRSISARFINGRNRPAVADYRLRSGLIVRPYYSNCIGRSYSSKCFPVAADCITSRSGIPTADSPPYYCLIRRSRRSTRSCRRGRRRSKPRLTSRFNSMLLPTLIYGCGLYSRRYIYVISPLITYCRAWPRPILRVSPRGKILSKGDITMARH
jgi:hypothetical protein